MRQRDFEYSGGERRDERGYRGDGGRDRPSREETWSREGRWELPADQDVEWYRRSAPERSTQEGPFAGRGPRGYQRSDQSIFEEVCERLTAHGYIDATEIDVEVRQGIVTLTGTAPDRRQKRVAEETIENVAGVQDVQNELRLAGRGGAEAAAEASKRGSTREERQIAREEPQVARDERQIARDERQIARQARDDREAAPQTAPKDDAKREEATPTREQTNAGERFQPVGSADGSSFDRPQDRSQDLPKDQTGQAREERKADAGFGRRDERQPVGVMGREGDRQPEMTTPRSAGATDQPLGTTQQGTGDTSETKAGQMDAAPAGAMSGASANEATGSRAGDAPVATDRLGDGASDREGQRNREREDDRDREGQRDKPDLDATRVQAATREVRLQAGAPVYSREGEKIGEVAEGSGDFFVVHKGLIFASELYFPAASILRSDENGVQLNVSKDDVANYKERPAAARAG